MLGKSGKTVCKGAVCVKSLVWPGWYTVASGGKHASVYVGYAHKYKLNYYPVSPEATLAECTDRTEFVVPE